MKKKCADPILELLGIEHLHNNKHPLIWIPDIYPQIIPKTTQTDKTSEGTQLDSLYEKPAHYEAEPNSSCRAVNSETDVDFSEYFVDTKEDGPYASLLTDETFKKAFSPDTEQGKRNLLYLLNDMLEGQIPHRILDVYSQQTDTNESGSKESRTSIFDLHCRDESGDFIEIEVQIRKKQNFLKRLAFYSSQMVVKQGILGNKWDYEVKPTYVIAVTRHNVFDDDHPIHRAGILDYETGKRIIDSVNYTVVELTKITRIIRENDSEAVKWMYAFRYLNRLKRLPPALNQGKFKGLLESAKIARFNREELERYRNIMKMEWDDYADWVAIAEDHPEYVKSIENAHDQEIVQMINNGMSLESLKKYLEGTKA